MRNLKTHSKLAVWSVRTTCSVNQHAHCIIHAAYAAAGYKPFMQKVFCMPTDKPS